MAYVITKSPAEEEMPVMPSDAAREETKIESFLELDPLSLEIGYGLIPLVDTVNGELLGKIKAMRRQLATELGFVVARFT